MSKAESAYRTIAEVSDLLQVQPSVLRFWETQFHQIKPMKRMGRRYYTAQDIVLLARIRDLLYQDGFTIKGVQKQLKEKSEAMELLKDAKDDAALPIQSQKNVIASDAVVKELKAIRDSLKPYLD